MRIHEIIMRNFMIVEAAHIKLPPRGIVAITGPNGHGKSAIIEAIPAAVWNETLRGTPWHNIDKKSVAQVSLETSEDVWDIIRGKTAKGSNSLKINSEERQFDSPSKAKATLAASAGSFDVWKRTHVFSSSDDAHFSRATDGQKKAFVESLLALDFNKASKLVKKDLSSEKKKLERAQADYRLADTKQAYEKKRMEEAMRSRDNLEIPDEPEVEEDLQEHLRGLQSSRSELIKNRREKAQELTIQESVLHQAEKNQKTLGTDVCAWCKQPIAEHIKEELAAEVQQASARLEEVRASIETELELLDAAIEEMDTDVDTTRTAQAESSEARRTFLRLKKEKERQAAIIEEATAANASYLRSRAECRGQIDEHSAEVDVLKLVDKVLGLRGVRANITADTLKGLESIANHWLHRFTGGEIQLSIKPYRELKSKRGAVNEEWSMDVVGAGGGFGYKAASAGQRQRIDVALLFASAQIAQAAFGSQDGTMFFDEVFDHLDKPGTQAVVEALGELAEERTVVVISHSDALVEALRPTLHLHVQYGKVTTI